MWLMYFYAKRIYIDLYGEAKLLVKKIRKKKNDTKNSLETEKFYLLC